MAVQIKKLLEANKDGDKEKECQELYWQWLSGCGKNGVEAVGEEVIMLSEMQQSEQCEGQQ